MLFFVKPWFIGFYFANQRYDIDNQGVSTNPSFTMANLILMLSKSHIKISVQPLIQSIRYNSWLHCKYLQWKYRFYLCPFSHCTLLQVTTEGVSKCSARFRLNSLQFPKKSLTQWVFWACVICGIFCDKLEMSILWNDLPFTI